MGWTGCYLKKGTNLNEFFNKEFKCKFIGKGALIHLSEYYRPFMQKDGKYNVMVCLVHYKPKEDFNFSFKSMSADMGPFYYNCPEWIINQVKDNFTDNKDAQKWLKECQKRIEQKKKQKVILNNLKSGDIINFDGVFEFKDGREYNTFVCRKVDKKKRIELRAYDKVKNEVGYRVELNGWKNMNFKVIGNINSNNKTIG